MQSIAATLTKALASNGIITLTGTATSLWLIPFALKYMDRAEYGIFILASDAMLWITLLDFGTSGGLALKISKHRGEQNQEQDVAVSSAMVFQEWTGLAIALFGCTISLGFPFLFPIPADLALRATTTFAIMSLATGVTNMGRVYTTLLAANRLAHVDNTIKAVGILVRCAAIAAGLIAGQGVLALAYATLAVAVASNVTTKIICQQRLPNIRIARILSSRETAASINRTGIWFSLNTLANTILRTSDRIIAARTLGMNQLANLSITSRIYEICQANLAMIPNNSWPLLAERHSTAGPLAAEKLWSKVTSFANALSAVAVGTIWAINRDFIRLWTGDQMYAGDSVDTLIALTVLTLGFSYSFRSALTASGRMKTQAILRLCEAVLFAGLAVPIGMKYGLPGIAATRLFSTLACSLACLACLTATSFTRNPASFCASQATAILKLVVVVAPVCIAARTISSTNTTIAILAAKGTLCLLTSTTLVWGLFLSSDERRMALSILTRKRLAQPLPMG